jgi:hypothetical protein
VADSRYGKRKVIAALTRVLDDPESKPKELLKAAELIAEINGWMKDKVKDTGKVSNLLGGMKK